jgi:FMN-dependent NADH-azoreductase
VQTYLESVLTDMLGAQVEFIVPELTMAHAVPAMADLVPIAEASRISCLRIAAKRARDLAANFSAGSSLSA